MRRSGASICVSFPRASSQPWIVASSPGSAAVGCREVDRVRGPVCDPGETPASDDAYISRRPAPAAFAGAGPDPHEDGDPHRDEPVPEGHAVLVERARGVHLQHHDRAVGLGLIEPLVQVGAERPVDRALHLEHHDLRGW